MKAHTIIHNYLNSQKILLNRLTMGSEGRIINFNEITNQLKIGLKATDVAK